jgi:hypothetical protein
MARKSSESLSVVPVTSLPTRLDPPENFPLAESEVWREVVATKPVDWFEADSAPLLAEYCRAKVMCDRLASRIDLASDEELKDLLVMRDREAKRLTVIGVKLRLTQQSRYTPKAAATANKAPNAGKVWQFGS